MTERVVDDDADLDGLLDDVVIYGDVFVIMRDDMPTAVLVDYDTYRRLTA